VSAPYRVLLAEQGTPEWLQQRKCGIGASEAAAVLGETSWGSPLTVYLDKRSDTTVDVGTDLMEFGHLAEPLIVAFIEAHPERYGYIGQIVDSPGLLQSIEYPWLLGTLDREVILPDGTRVPLELKSVNDHVKREWTVGATEDEWGDATEAQYQVPRKYQVQVQQQMAVTGAPFAYVAAWLGKDTLALIRVERDEEFIQEYLVGVLGRFWNENVLTGTPPAPILGDKLWELWPGERGLEVDADGDVIDLVGLWRVERYNMSQAKKAVAELALQIASYMGDATELLDPITKEPIHTLRGQRTPSTLDRKKLQDEYPDAYQAALKPQGWTRVHRPTKAQVEA
jgi:putative phage-type endonuclease